MQKFGGHGNTGRVEDFRFVTGGGRYVDDLQFGGVLHMHVVRSLHGHAKIKKIETSDSLAMPGVFAVLTGSDLASDGLGTIPCVSKPRRADLSVQSIVEPPHRALAIDRVRMVGEAVAIVVAGTRAQAADAAEAVVVDYDALSAVIDPASALEKGAPQLWDVAPQNTSFIYEIGDRAGVDRALAGAAHLTRLKLLINRVTAMPMEPRVVVGEFDRGNGRYTLHVGHQTPHQLRHVLANSIFHVPEHQVRVVSPDVGGGFGLKGGLFAEDILVLWASRRLVRAVKWVCERGEAFLSDDHARETLVDATLALDVDGRFLALDYKALANLGSVVAFRGAHPPTNNLGSLSGPYKTPAIHAHVTGVFTNTRPTASYRGAGRPEATYVLERLIDVAAAELRINPFELRRKNLIPADAMPYQTNLLFKYDSGDFSSNMDRASTAIDLPGFESRRAASLKAGKLRGVGIANSIEQAGGPVGSPWEERVEIRFDLSGGIRILVGTMSNGQGHETIFQQIAVERLGVKGDKVHVLQGDTDVSPFGRGTFGSRSMMSAGSAIVMACEKVIAKGKRIAAFLLQCSSEDVGFSNGIFTCGGSGGSVSMHDVVKAAFNVNALPIDLEGGLDQIATFCPPAPTYPNACHICEVEIDPDTGHLQILRYVIVDDVGTVLDHAGVEGQVQGGVVQGIGQCLTENVVYQDNGQVTTGSFMDYGMPRASDVPSCEIETNGTTTLNNPLGVKGAGEAGTIGALPAVMNAVMDALSPYKIRHLDMPATSERVWHAIHTAGAASNP